MIKEEKQKSPEQKAWEDFNAGFKSAEKGKSKLVAWAEYLGVVKKEEKQTKVGE